MAGIQRVDACTALDIKALWDVLNELCDVRSKWKMIGLGLRLEPSDLDAMSGSVLDCLQSSLSKWLKGIDPLPTWEALVAVLRSPVVGEEKKAQELEEKFCSGTPILPDTPTPVKAKEEGTCEPTLTSRTVGVSEASDSSVTSPTHLEHETTPISDTSSLTYQLSPMQSMEDGESTEGPLPSPAAEVDVDDDVFVDDSRVSSQARPSLQSYVERMTDSKVKKKVKRKDNQFRTLVRKTHRHLSRTIKSQEDFADFKVAITLLPASINGHHILLSPDDRTAIMGAKSFDQMFVVLNQYWTFHQYELLEYIVQEYGNARLKKEMKAYVDDTDELEAQVGIDHFTAVRLCYQRPDSVAMDIRLSGTQHMLCDARLVQRSVAGQCGLHPHTVCTYQSTPGSTVLTLLIPYAVAGHVMATFRGMLPAGDILSRPLEERVVYTMDEAETEMHLPLKVQNIDSADHPVSTGRRQRRGSGDSSHASTGYDTLSKESESEAGVMDESSSQIAMLTRIIREKEKEVEEFLQNLPPSEKPAEESRAVFILGSIAPHSNEAVVPQSPADLSDDDRQVLTELGLPPDKWDNLNALLAVYNKTEAYDVFSVQVSKPGMELSRSYVLEQIEYLLINSANKEGAVIHYYGNGRRNTGDWCFRDGYITFRDIASLYMKHCRGRVLVLVPDCHSSGHWVGECAKFLDEQGVRPCGHLATERGILLKVCAACKTGQDAAELCYTTQAMELRDDGFVYHWTGKELSDQQETLGVDFTRMRCGKGKGEECSIASNSTWSTASEVISERIFIVRGTEKGRPAWHYILLDDDAEKIRDFIHKTQGENAGKYYVNQTHYGTVLKSGWGKDPPQDVQDWREKYGCP